MPYFAHMQVGENMRSRIGQLIEEENLSVSLGMSGISFPGNSLHTDSVGC